MDDLDGEDNVEAALYPVHARRTALPPDTATKFAYSLYNPSPESLILKSERNRRVFAEALILNPRLGPLTDLCVSALSRKNGLNSLALTVNAPNQRRLQLDSIDVDLPLEEIYEIEDRKFWKRVAVAKTENAALSIKPDDYDWKSEAVTLKFVELIENCPAEYWREMEMCNLARKIKDNVKNMHIKKLQPLKESSFSHYQVRDSDTEKTTSTDVSDTTRSSEDDFEVEAENTEMETVAPSDTRSLKHTSSKMSSGMADQHMTPKSFGLPDQHSIDTEFVNEDEVFEMQRLRNKLQLQKENRREERRKRRELQLERRKLREQKRLEYEEARNHPKPKRIRVKNVFDLPIDEPEDKEHKRHDARNLESYLKYKRKNCYQPEHCHHIDLQFLSIFDNLVSFQIEFLPPKLKTNYHSRYFNFSKDDIWRLSKGIMWLQKLRTFRLRDSRMDEEKLMILIHVLNQMRIEVLDFGNDHLNDNCEIALRELLLNATTIKSLELEGNQLGVNSMKALGRSLTHYSGDLEYLGLARNPIGSDGLHALISRIANTKQIKALNLAGMRISDSAMLCCIGEELLNRHKVLQRLDLMSSPMSPRSGEQLIKFMRSNFNVLALECRGCDLSENIEMDIEICLRRNRYKAENPFIADNQKTEADVKEFVNRIKNPTILRVMEEMEKKKACMDSRPDLTPLPSASKQSPSESSTSSSFEPFLFYGRAYRSSFKAPSLTSSSERSSENKRFSYNVMAFNEKELNEDVYIPGPENRYYYFQSKKDDYWRKFE